MKFPLASGAYAYRALKLGASPRWDVWALQSALGVARDGHFGPLTEASTIAFQRRVKMKAVDGIAGNLTQRELGVRELAVQEKRMHLPVGLGLGMIEGESGFWLGNHSLTYYRFEHGTRYAKKDCGVCQFATRLVDEAALERAFDVPLSVRRLCEQMRVQHDAYWQDGDNPKVTSQKQAWTLAVRSWNAPAFANWQAGVRPWAVPSSASVAALKSYSDTKLVYVKEWTA